MRRDADEADPIRAATVRPPRVDYAHAGWAIVIAALAVAALAVTSRPEPARGQTGPALTPPAAQPEPPPETTERVTVSVTSFAGRAQASGSSAATVRVLDVATLESRPSRRRLPQAIPRAAEQFVATTSGGQAIAGIQIQVGPTGGGTLPGSLTRVQLAELCFPASMKPPGVGPDDLIVSPGRRLRARQIGRKVCVDFAFTETGTFIVGARPQPVIPELAAFYAATGGEATWGPCLTHGFFAAVGPAGRIVEVSPGMGPYVQVCANGALSFRPELAGTGYEVQPLLATHWVRGEDGRFVEADLPQPDLGEGRYFPQTGHNVSGALLAAFQALGGVEVLGYPITEAVPAAPGYTDQYFQHLKLRLHDASGQVGIRPVGRELISVLTRSGPAEAQDP